MRALVGLLAVAAAVLAPAAVASASDQQESMFQDDSLLVYGAPSEQSNALDIMKALGVDRVRVTVYWRLVAPDPDATTKPKFDATDPNAYPAVNWDRYDTLVRLAAAKGIGVNFNVSAPAPAWATSNGSRSDVADVANPDAGEFGKFVQAVGARYTGAFTPAAASNNQQQPNQSPPPSNPTPQLPLPTASAARDAHAAQAAGGPLPRVSFWSIWNEPNQGGWLNPQWQNGQPTSPRLYRALVDSSWAALGTTGHQGDVVLVGETAPKGSDAETETSGMKPLVFLRALYCVDKQYHPLQGAAADAVGCPAQNNGTDFVNGHPGLFASAGYGHHPYNFPLPPNLKSKDPDFLALADTPRLVKFLNGTFASYGQSRPGGMPIWFTEYGYQTKPPDPLGITWAQQAEYLNETEYMAWNYPQVMSTSQFLLVDDKPNSAYPAGSIKYWGTFQTGLLELDGSRKAAFYSYPVPIWLPKTHVKKGKKFLVWAMRRDGNNGDPQAGTVQYAGLHGKRYKNLKGFLTTDPRGYAQTKVSIKRSGSVRVAWRNPGGGVTLSRPVAVTVGKAKKKKR
jgi:hypothetical protein